jgi:energy-converting hydrogenase Eha subunit C
MSFNMWWVLAWGTVTVLAGFGVVLASPPEDRPGALAWFVGGAVCAAAVLTFFLVLGWWTP